MIDMIECGTCGYPLLPEERRSLVESNGKMVKPWLGLTKDDINEMIVDVWLKRNRYAEADELRWFAELIEAKLEEKNNG